MFNADGIDQTQNRGLVGEKTSNSGAAFDFLVKALRHIGGP